MQSEQHNNMTPIRSQILFKPFPPDTISTGGIYVPETAQQVNNKGTVIKVGRGTKDRPMMLKPGDIGHRVKDWGCEVIIDGEKHYLMDQDAILAIN